MIKFMSRMASISLKGPGKKQQYRFTNKEGLAVADPIDAAFFRNQDSLVEVDSNNAPINATVVVGAANGPKSYRKVERSIHIQPHEGTLALTSNDARRSAEPLNLGYKPDQPQEEKPFKPPVPEMPKVTDKEALKKDIDKEEEKKSLNRCPICKVILKEDGLDVHMEAEHS